MRVKIKIDMEVSDEHVLLNVEDVLTTVLPYMGDNVDVKCEEMVD